MRVEDFAWWTGLRRTAAAAVMAQLPCVEVGEELMLLQEDAPAFERVTPLGNSVGLLPKWDAYTMGLAPDGRARLVHPDNQPRIYVQAGVTAPGQPRMGLPGDGYPVVLVDGEAVGTWYLSAGSRNVELFDTVGARTRRNIEERLDAAAALLTG